MTFFLDQIPNDKAQRAAEMLAEVFSILAGVISLVVADGLDVGDVNRFNGRLVSTQSLESGLYTISSNVRLERCTSPQWRYDMADR